MVPASSAAEKTVVVDGSPDKTTSEVKVSRSNGTDLSTSVKVEASTAAMNKSRQFIKLDRYDGKSEIKAFLRGYEICARHNAWSNEERLDQLMCSLSAPADQFLWDFGSTSVMNWSDLVQKLRSRYGSSDQTSLYQTQLGTRRQRDDEDLNGLVQDIRRLMSLAYPGCAAEHGEVIAVRAFLDAMKDQSLALKVREREPTSLDAAFKLGLRLDG